MAEEIVLDREQFEFEFIEPMCRGGQADIQLWSLDGVKVAGEGFHGPGPYR
jgi:hypothetical protein